MIGFPLSANLQ